MHGRRQFIGAALVKGALWFGWVGGLITLLISGSVAGVLILLLDISVVVTITIVLAAFLVLFVEGSYRVWREENRARLAAERTAKELEENPRSGISMQGVYAWNNQGGGVVIEGIPPRPPNAPLPDEGKDD